MMTPPPRPAPVTLYVDGAQVEAVAVLPGNVCPNCGAQVEASGRIMHIVGARECCLNYGGRECVQPAERKQGE